MVIFCVFAYFVFNCHYQCSLLPGEPHLQNDLLCVEFIVILYSFTVTEPIHVLDYGCMIETF